MSDWRCAECGYIIPNRVSKDKCPRCGSLEFDVDWLEMSPDESTCLRLKQKVDEAKLIIKQLNETIEKLKHCDNCKHYDIDEDGMSICLNREERSFKTYDYRYCNNWEIV